jgi:polyvinyl alcohol dehydrogenase (cytochrome)
MTNRTLALAVAWVAPMAVAWSIAAQDRPGQAPEEPRAVAGGCPQPAERFAPSRASWNGWSPDPRNWRFQAAEQAGLTRDRVPRLALSWAFGFPRTTAFNAQPTVAGGRVFIPSANRVVYSLDAASGCQFWTFEPDAPVRASIAIGTPPGAQGPLAFFADTAASTYALDANTGALVWKARVDTHPRASVRGAVAYFDGRVFVPLTAAEEGASPNPKYECCTARGALAALDAATGRVLWKTYTIDEEPRPTGKSSAGTTMWGPSGASIWSAPTIDVERRVVYAGTGNNFSHPATSRSDAVLAFDMATGRILWSRQLATDDVWNNACLSAQANCPERAGPDHDIAAPPMLVTLSDGRRILLVGQKSGEAWGLDPDRQGAVVWRRQVGKGIPVFGSILWGVATDGEKMYVAVADVEYLEGRGATGGRRPDPTAGGGLHALDVATGVTTWTAPPQACDRPNCSPAQPAPISVMPGVVFAGALDGRVRGYATADGTVLWTFDTAREVATVNGVPAQGGSTRTSAPIVVDGMLYVGSGAPAGTVSSVLLAFSVPRE